MRVHCWRISEKMVVEVRIYGRHFETLYWICRRKYRAAGAVDMRFAFLFAGVFVSSRAELICLSVDTRSTTHHTALSLLSFIHCQAML